MSKQIDALKLALEALEESHPEAYCHVITAIKAVLAQPEQEPVAWRETHSKVIKALAAIVTVHTPDKLFDLDAIPRDPVMGLVQQIKSAIDGYKPPQSTWVGLTPQERDEINEQVYGAVPHHVAFHHAIEAKLKEKNT